MSEIDYESICKKNREKYGTEVHNYAKVLLADSYKESTHFLYELLQNAEDSSERRYMKSKTENTFYAKIELYEDRLEFRHNGDPFDLKDVEGICGIVNTTKTEELGMIGKFGIGFKSVYAYTKTPKIYSGEFSFSISDYVLPNKIEKRNDLKASETLIVVPFNDVELNSKSSYQKIKSKLSNIDYNILLFLNRIRKLSITVDGKENIIEKIEEKISDKNSFFELVGPDKKEEWLVFFESNKEGVTSTVRIAYKIEENNNHKKIIVPVPGAKVFNYFETDRLTKLKFHVDGPFHTTPARDNIKQDDWNESLIKKAALLVCDSLEKIKDLGYLTIDCLNTLPLDPLEVDSDPIFYGVFYSEVKLKLINSRLLPGTFGYQSPKESLISRSEELSELLGKEQLKLLLKKDAGWLDYSITEDKYPTFRSYLINELSIEVLDPGMFSEKVENAFFLFQSDDWMIRFYKFLRNERSLWDAFYRRSVLRRKQIIRLHDNSHIEPFNENLTPKAHLPSDKIKLEENYGFNTVKENIVKNKEAKEFLIDLGLKEVSRETVIVEKVLPRYSLNSNGPNEIDNLKHLNWIILTIKGGTQVENENLIDEIKCHPILMGRNAKTGEKMYQLPSKIFIPKSFTGSSELEDFYENDENVWFLDEMYANKDLLDLDILSSIGCNSEIKVETKEPERNGFVELINQHSYHLRGLDGFDPNANIFDLECVLSTPNLKKAKILWSLLRYKYNVIKGDTEWSSTKDFQNSTKEKKTSILGEILIKNSWIPKLDGSYAKPEDVKMSDIIEEVFMAIPESVLIAEKLGIAVELDDDINNILLGLPLSVRREAKKRFLYVVSALTSQKMPPDQFPEFKKKFVEGLDGKPQQQQEENNYNVWNSITSLEEESIRENSADNTRERVMDSGLNVKIKLSKELKNDGFDPKTYLKDEYNGHCQICNTRLDIGGFKDPYFEIYRVSEIRYNPNWGDVESNVICLCPNCHALAKHGGLKLTEIKDSVADIINLNKIPEAVPKRNGDYYIFNVLLAGRSVQIFYTQRHLNQVISTLQSSEEH